jgi:hypothetical protein
MNWSDLSEQATSVRAEYSGSKRTLVGDLVPINPDDLSRTLAFNDSVDVIETFQWKAVAESTHTSDPTITPDNWLEGIDNPVYLNVSLEGSIFEIKVLGYSGPLFMNLSGYGLDLRDMKSNVNRLYKRMLPTNMMRPFQKYDAVDCDLFGERVNPLIGEFELGKEYLIQTRGPNTVGIVGATTGIKYG